MRLPVLTLIIPLSARRRDSAGQPCPAQDGQFRHHSHRQGRRLRLHADGHSDRFGRPGSCARKHLCARRSLVLPRERRVKGRAELGIRIEKMTFASGKVIQVNPNLSSVDAGGTSQKVDKEQEIKQGSDVGRDAARVSTLRPAPLSAAGPIIAGRAPASALAWAVVSASRLYC